MAKPYQRLYLRHVKRITCAGCGARSVGFSIGWYRNGKWRTIDYLCAMCIEHQVKDYPVTHFIPSPGSDSHVTEWADKLTPDIVKFNLLCEETK